MTTDRFFAIVPAAGRSERMGCSKLLLRWCDKPILEHALLAWQQSRVARTVVVARGDDMAVRALCTQHNVECITPAADPQDMKQSVEYGLEYIACHCHPTEHDAWLLAPADMPRLSAALIDLVIGQYQRQHSVVVPRCGSRTGHPVLFPWPLSQAVFQLAENEGINRLVAIQAEQGRVTYVDLPDPAVFDDIDTPEDFERLSL